MEKVADQDTTGYPQRYLVENDGLQDGLRNDSIVNTSKGRWDRIWPVIACGAGLFSDGYLNNVSRQRSQDIKSQITRDETN